VPRRPYSPETIAALDTLARCLWREATANVWNDLREQLAREREAIPRSPVKRVPLLRRSGAASSEAPTR
jgi:hypothetical protein